MLAQGELLSSTLGVAYLRSQGLPVEWLDARDWLHAQALPNQNEWSRRLSVSCRYEGDADLRARFAGDARAADHPGLHRAQRGWRHRDPRTRRLGYVGRLFRRVAAGASASKSGPTCRACSAPIRAWCRMRACSRAWTTRRRRKSPPPAPRCCIRAASTRAARRACRSGSATPSARRLPGTVIDASRRDACRASRRSVRASGIVLVSMESIGMWQQVGFLADVFERFKRHGLSVDLIGSSETNVTVSLDPSDNLVNSNVLDALCADLARSLPGQGDRALRGDHAGRPRHALAAAQAVRRLDRVRPRARAPDLAKSSNDLNLTFVVDEALAEGLMPRLHATADRSPARCRWMRRRCSGRAGARSTQAAERARGAVVAARARARCCACADAGHAALCLPPADGARAARARWPTSARSTGASTR